MSQLTDLPFNRQSLDKLNANNNNQNVHTPILTHYSDKYKSFIKREHKWLIPLLDTLKSLTLFIPGRFSAHSEVRSEAIYSTINLIQSYNDRILHKQSTAANNEIALNYINSTHKLYNTIQTLQHILTVLYYTEVLVEMLATKYGNNKLSQYALLRHKKFKWIVVFTIELIKFYCRMRILCVNKGHMLLTRSADQIQWDTLQRDAQNKKTEFIQQSVTDLNKLNTDKLANYNNTIQPCQSLINTYIEHGRYGHQHGKYVAPKLDPAYTTTPNQLKIICEVLYWFRPLVYTGGQIFTDTDVEWNPWTWSLLTDLCAILPLFSQTDLTIQQRSEVLRRFSLLTYYLVRTPFFEQYTQQPLIKISSVLSHVPLFGVVFGNIAELINVLQKHYFYVSAS